MYGLLEELSLFLLTSTAGLYDPLGTASGDSLRADRPMGTSALPFVAGWHTFGAQASAALRSRTAGVHEGLAKWPASRLLLA